MLTYIHCPRKSVELPDKGAVKEDCDPVGF